MDIAIADRDIGFGEGGWIDRPIQLHLESLQLRSAIRQWWIEEIVVDADGADRAVDDARARGDAHGSAEDLQPQRAVGVRAAVEISGPDGGHSAVNDGKSLVRAK